MTTTQKNTGTMNILLWIAQGFLALILVWAGFMKLVQPDALPFPWIRDNQNLVLIAGIADLAGGLGIVLPALFRIQPRLTIYAAYGIIALMVAAIVFHISRGEAKDTGFNIFMLLLALFVAWGRQVKAPIAAKRA